MQGMPIEEKTDCTGCAACYCVCPSGCISMRADSEGFLYPIIDDKKCKNCGLCINVCTYVKEKIPKHKMMRMYGIKSNNETERYLSSSGGVFSLISREIIRRNGVVFGVAFDSNWKVIHTLINSEEDINRLRGSKYVQSNVLDTYSQAKKILTTGKLVYYSGTPCQIAGLRAFLDKDYDNLITQDLICHGVPSPEVWEKYINTVRKKHAIKQVLHRDKVLGWSRFSLTVEYENGKKLTEDLTENAFLRGFLCNLFLRPSCHNCRYKGKERISDITLADFWGCNHIEPSLYDEKGSSLVLVNTLKGHKLLDGVLSNTEWTIIDNNQVFDYNSAAIRSVRPHKNRDVFFERFRKQNNTEKLILSLIEDSLIKKNFRVKRRMIKGVLSKTKRRFIRI